MIHYINKTKIKTTALILSLLVLIVSCDSILDEQPISEIGTTKFWKNNTDALAGVVSMYDGMQSTYRLNHYLWGDMRSDNFQVRVTSTVGDYIELGKNIITPGNTSVRWNYNYIMINRANQAIKNIPNIPGYNKSLLAEAYAVRAKAYFDAVRVWGAVPLYLEPTESIADLNKSRTPGATILTDVIIPDMLKAEELMETTQSEFRFSKGSVYCLQADVYMWTKEYGKAKIAIDKMIGLGAYSLVKTVDDWENLFYNTPITATTPTAKGKKQIGPELIFSIRFDLLEDGILNRSGAMNLFNAGLPSFYVSADLENKWIARFPTDKAEWEAKYPGVAPQGVSGSGLVYGDWRYFLCRNGGYDNVVGPVAMTKYNKTQVVGTFDDTDIVIYRYAGMLLLLAEAENQLNADGTAALSLVNQIRTARKLPLVKADEFGATKEERENYILDERQFELLGEGQRWWDLRRTNKAMEVMNPILETITGAKQLTENRLLFPVYFEHLQENPNLLPQNAGY